MLRLFSPIIIFLFFSASLPLSLLAQRSPDMEKIRRREIVDVRFEGDSNISALELQSIIATRPSNLIEYTLNGITSDWGSPHQFVDENNLAEDTLRIFVYYRSRGYFDAKVSVSYLEHQSKASLDAFSKVEARNNLLPPQQWEKYPLIADTVVFRIVEGKSYKVAGFTFEGLEKLPMDLQNTITSKIGIKVNSQYSKDALDLEILRVKEILGENGYPFLSLPNGATVIETDTSSKTITISLKFKTGPRIRVGGPRIINDTAYVKYGYVQEQVIRRQITMDSGTWYENSDKVETQRGISKLGTFQYINIELDTSAFANLPDSAKNGLVLPVVIFLRMRPSWEITPGPYFGENRQGEFIGGLGVSYSNRNLFNVADNLTLQATYQFFPLPNVQKRWSLSGDFVFPYIGIKNVPFIISPSFSYAWVFEKYKEAVYGGSLGLNFELLNTPTFRLTYLPKGSLQFVQREYNDTTLRPLGNTSFVLNPQQLNSIYSHELKADWTNDPQYPSHGSYTSWSFQWALPLLKILFPGTTLPSASYLKNTLQFKTYFDLGSTPARSVLAYRIMGGFISLSDPGNPNKDPLIEDRYYGGGTNSLRGWSARSLLVSNDRSLGRPQFGGYKAFETNLEWRYALVNYPVAITSMQQFLSALRLAFFCDVGNIWDKEVPIAPKNFVIALGTGLRYYTLLGALRFDFGFKFYDPFPDPYPPGTLGTDKPNIDNLMSAPPNSTPGVFIWDRKGKFWNVFADVFSFKFALGQAF